MRNHGNGRSGRLLGQQTSGSGQTTEHAVAAVVGVETDDISESLYGGHGHLLRDQSALAQCVLGGTVARITSARSCRDRASRSTAPHEAADAKSPDMRIGSAKRYHGSRQEDWWPGCATRGFRWESLSALAYSSVPLSMAQAYLRRRQSPILFPSPLYSSLQSTCSAQKKDAPVRRGEQVR